MQKETSITSWSLSERKLENKYLKAYQNYKVKITAEFVSELTNLPDLKGKQYDNHLEYEIKQDKKFGRIKKNKRQLKLLIKISNAMDMVIEENVGSERQ